MGAVLGSIGLVGFLAAAVWLIVAAVRKQPKRIPAGVLGVFFVLFIVGVVLTGTTATPQDGQAEESGAPATTEATATPRPTPTATRTSTDTATPTPSPTPMATPTPSSPTAAGELIVNNPSELDLTISDLPVGWEVVSQGAVAGGYSFRALRRQPVLDELSGRIGLQVISRVSVFPSVLAATEEYETQRSKVVGKYALGEPYLKSDSFWFFVDGSHVVQFRINNVVAYVESQDLYGTSEVAPKEWGRKLEAKINDVKRMGDTVAVASPSPTP